MYVLMKSQGVHIEPWRQDVRVGAVLDGDKVYLSVAAKEPWSGRLVFDKPRHKVNFHLPLDYPRINQMSEWFTVEDEKSYEVRDSADGNASDHSGREMAAGLNVDLKADQEKRFIVSLKK